MAVVGAVTISGAKELQKKLKGLPEKVANKIIRKALRSGAKIIERQAEINAPVLTGQLKKSIKVKSAKRRKKGEIGVSVITGKGDFKGDQFYASFLEFGFKRGKRELGDDRQKVGPYKFMEPAFEAKKEEAARTIEQEMLSGIEAIAK